MRGATTNGLIATHFIPAAMDHGMPPTTAAGLLAVVGIFDVGGTIASGWFTDRVDPRMLLLAYYTLRGVGLAVLPSLLSPHTTPSTWVGGPIVFGWVFASHQIGAAVLLSISIRRVAPRPDLASVPRRRARAQPRHVRPAASAMIGDVTTTLYQAGCIVAFQDGQHRILRDGCLVVEDDRIIHVGTTLRRPGGPHRRRCPTGSSRRASSTPTPTSTSRPSTSRCRRTSATASSG